jgi:hypothetical protein
MRVVTYPPKMAPSALLPRTAKRMAAHVGFDCAPMSPAIGKGQTSTLQPNHAEPVSALGPELEAWIDSPSRLGPEGGGASTSQGHARTVFRRALERGNLLVAEATAKEIGRLTLGEALELTLLIAREDPRRHPRVAARWLRRYLDESLDVTIDEAAMVAASLAALTGRGRETAVEALRAMAERATRRARRSGP